MQGRFDNRRALQFGIFLGGANRPIMTRIRAIKEGMCAGDHRRRMGNHEKNKTCETINTPTPGTGQTTASLSKHFSWKKKNTPFDA